MTYNEGNREEWLGRKARIGIIFGDGALGCWVRARRIARRLEGWAEVFLRPFGGEFRDDRYRSWHEDISCWIRGNAFDLIIDDQALIGIIAAISSNTPVISLIQHHPIWAESYGEAVQILQFANKIVIPMWEWIGDDGLSSLKELKEQIVWVGPILEDPPIQPLEQKMLLVTEGSAKYDETLFTIAKQAARFLNEWTIKLNIPDERQFPAANLPENCTVLPITDQFSQVLARSQAVACAGGITMLEAIYYGKTPIVLPVPFQREQAWTAKRLAALGMAKVITASIKTQTFTQMVLESVQEKPAASFPLTSGLDGLENIVKEQVSWPS
jgi:Glycosyltransferase family 28 C-terminal domain